MFSEWSHSEWCCGCDRLMEWSQRNNISTPDAGLQGKTQCQTGWLRQASLQVILRGWQIFFRVCGGEAGDNNSEFVSQAALGGGVAGSSRWVRNPSSHWLRKNRRPGLHQRGDFLINKSWGSLAHVSRLKSATTRTSFVSTVMELKGVEKRWTRRVWWEHAQGNSSFSNLESTKNLIQGVFFSLVPALKVSAVK